MSSEIEKILSWFYREEFSSGALNFDDLLLKAAKSALGKTEAEAEAYSYRNSEGHWNKLLQRLDYDFRLGRSPLFQTSSKVSRKIIWFPHNINAASTSREKQKAGRMRARPQMMQIIDSMSDRQYEALGCVICNMIGATNVKLTPRGNEGGIDFFAVINSPSRCHVFHGDFRPLRIIGQSKKYRDKVQVDRVKELIETIDEVKNLNPSVEPLIPSWFRSSSGPVIGWLIAHSGAQSGAISKAQNHGIIISDSIDMAEIAAMSHQTDSTLPVSDRATRLQEAVVKALEEA